MVMPGRMVELAPTAAPVRTRIGLTSQSASVLTEPSRLTARGIRSFVKHTCGPMKTPSSTVTPR
jgi:hypothetical protein